MNATLPTRGRVHWMRDGAPRCGGGGHGKHGPWQMDLGDVTCRRCLTLVAWDRSHEARGQARHEKAQKAREESNP